MLFLASENCPSAVEQSPLHLAVDLYRLPWRNLPHYMIKEALKDEYTSIIKVQFCVAAAAKNAPCLTVMIFDISGKSDINAPVEVPSQAK